MKTHGRVSTYQHARCRCDECRSAAARARRHALAKRRAQHPDRVYCPVCDAWFVGARGIAKHETSWHRRAA